MRLDEMTLVLLSLKGPLWILVMLYSYDLLVELHLSKACVQLYGVKQVASLCKLQVDC
jgi:hypothetical protein